MPKDHNLVHTKIKTCDTELISHTVMQISGKFRIRPDNQSFNVRCTEQTLT